MMTELIHQVSHSSCLFVLPGAVVATSLTSKHADNLSTSGIVIPTFNETQQLLEPKNVIYDIPSSKSLIIEYLHDFSNIAFVTVNQSSPDHANGQPMHHTADCNSDIIGNGVAERGESEPVYTTSWAQRLCISQTYKFAEMHGLEPDVVLLGDAVLRHWPATSASTWQWMAYNAARGPLANFACDMDSNSVFLQASELVRKFPVSPKWYVLGSGLYDCMSETKASEEIIANIQRTVEQLRAWNCHSHVIVLALLPAAENGTSLSWGSSQYRQCIDATNAGLQRYVADLGDVGVTFQNCADRFLLPGGETIDSRLLPDGVVPSALGYANLALCLAAGMTGKAAGLSLPAYQPHFNFQAHKSGDQPKAEKYAEVGIVSMWRFGGWGPCTATCGTGIQTRNAECIKLNTSALPQGQWNVSIGFPLDIPRNSSFQRAPDAECDESSLLILRTCQSWDCKQVGWVVGPWSSCSSPCGVGHMTRKVLCVDSKGREDKKEACFHQQQPRSIRVCNLQPCSIDCGPDGVCSGHGRCNSSLRMCSCDKDWSGIACHIHGSCASGLATKSMCCESGLVSALSGNCCTHGAVLDRHGDCCSSGFVDGCGICDGHATGIDIYGVCCYGQLDAAGLCCTSSAVDECGVCRGQGSTCNLEGILTVVAKSHSDLEKSVEYELLPGLAGLLSKFGLTETELSVTGIRLGSPEARIADVSFLAKAATRAGRSGFPQVKRVQQLLPELQKLPYPNITNIYALSRKGSCGNGICELGEQVREGTHDKDDCPEDCPIRIISCPVGIGPNDPQAECSAHGICYRISGACDCWPGYVGDACQYCDGGYDKHQNSGLCIPLLLPENTEISVRQTAGRLNSLPKSQQPAAQVVLGLLVALLAVATITVALVHCAAVFSKDEETPVTFQMCKLYQSNESVDDAEDQTATDCKFDGEVDSEHPTVNGGVASTRKIVSSRGSRRGRADRIKPRQNSSDICPRSNPAEALCREASHMDAHDYGNQHGPEFLCLADDWVVPHGEGEKKDNLGAADDDSRAAEAAKIVDVDGKLQPTKQDKVNLGSGQRMPYPAPSYLPTTAGPTASRSATQPPRYIHRGHQQGHEGFGSWELQSAIGFGSWDASEVMRTSTDSLEMQASTVMDLTSAQELAETVPARNSGRKPAEIALTLPICRTRPGTTQDQKTVHCFTKGHH